MKNYIISPVTVYDDEQELFGTKVGEKGKEMALFAIIYGKNEEESRHNAAAVMHFLNSSKV